MSPVWPCLLSLICLVLFGVEVHSQAGGAGVTVTTMEVTSSSITLNITCTGDQCEQTETSYIYTCIYQRNMEPKCKYRPGVKTFSDLKPLTQYQFIINRRSGWTWKALETLYITTKETILIAPEILKMPSMEEGTMMWIILGNWENITGFELNIVAWRDYNSSFSLNITEWFPPNVTEHMINLLPRTNYTFHLRGFTSVGAGDYKVITMETSDGVPTAFSLDSFIMESASGTSQSPVTKSDATSYEGQLEAGEEMDTAPLSTSFLRQLFNQTITPVLKELSDIKADVQHIGRRVESLEQRQTMIIADIKALLHGLHTQGAHINNASLALEDHIGI